MNLKTTASIITLILFLAAGWVAGATRPAKWEKRDAWQNVPGIFAAMGVEPGSWVADVGSRDGYLSLRLADAVGNAGRVYAVDIDEEALERLRETLEDESIQNVTTVHSEPDDPKLPPSLFDAVVIVNAYHEMDDYDSMLRHIKRALRPEGRLVVVDAISERKRGKSRDRQTSSHEIAMEYVKKDFAQAGFEIVQARDPFVVRPDEGDEMWLLAAVPRSR